MRSPGAMWRTVKRPERLRDTVHAALEDMIVHAVFQVGEHLPEEILAEQLGVSRQPIRESLLQLARDGFVDMLQGRGSYVHTPSQREIDDVFHVRALLEAEAARLAAKRITETTLRELRDICVRGDRAAGAADKRLLVDLNHSFHSLVIRSSDNTVLASMLAGLQKRIDWYFAVVAVERAPSSWEQHAKIVDALAAGDARRAGSLLTSHVQETQSVFQRSRDKHS